MTEPRMGLRVKVLAALVLAMFATLTTRLWFLQVLAAEQYKTEADDNAVRLIEVPAPRGVIKDVNGTLLVQNRGSVVITINRQVLGDQTERVLLDLSELLDIPADELGARLDDPRYYVFSPIPVASDVPKRVAYFIEEHPEDFPGVDVLSEPVRRYPLGSAGAHVLGYLGQISEDRLKDPGFADYSPGDVIGVSGIEGIYERYLAGTRGLVKYRVNSTGENLGVIGRQRPVAGDDVWLTLDAGTQQLAEESLKAGIEHARTIFESDSGYLRANGGTAIVLDPQTGAIEAMASYPTFDPGLFTRGFSQKEFDRRFGAGHSFPLVNRAIQGQYPPGSTYKPFVAASALQRDIVTTGGSYSCPPSWTAPYEESDPDAVQYVFNNWTTADLGYMNLSTALARSCDTVFYPMGYRYWDMFYVNDDEEANDVVSHEPLQHDLGSFGFGAQTRVDLPYEQDGRVPTAEWKQSIHDQYPESFPEGEWFPGDFILMTIGQGDTLVTPLQLATAYGALENDGKECVPHVLDRVVAPDDTIVRRYHQNCRKHVRIDERYLRYVRDALTGTMTGTGTAASAFAGFPFGEVWVAGKTGTAEVPPKQDYSWFAAMTAAGGREHVVVVLVEQGGHGATTAAPIARHIIEGLYGLEFSQFTEVAGTD
ncbi:MAG TPA: penicillin-binding protein 2 [Actinomycetota bacterium]|nr:penicillin-binding protein 2 [Actinomycetota bacterium]